MAGPTGNEGNLGMLQLLWNNKEWLFSGLGVFALGLLWHFFGPKRQASTASPAPNIVMPSVAVAPSTASPAPNIVMPSVAVAPSVSATHPPIKVPHDGTFSYKAVISEGNYAEFLWDIGTTRVTILRLVEDRKGDLSTEIEIDFPYRLLGHGASIIEKGRNQFLVPKQTPSELDCSVFYWGMGTNSLRFFRLFVDHINPHAKQVTVDVFFARFPSK